MKANEIRTIWLAAGDQPVHEVVNAWLDEHMEAEIVQLRVIEHAGAQPPSVFIIYRSGAGGQRSVGFARHRSG